ncbi:MAG: LysM peptidoglycan-binding domain-containing protein [Clostridiales bacterium]|nr:LysM peptidoglycan-binding domain-containing protein [Clostridiales bacterium]
MKKLFWLSVLLIALCNSSAFAFSDNLITHTVVSGESFWSIAKSFGINFFDLLALNNATQNSLLDIDDVVLLPTCDIEKFNVHFVLSGDSFFKISKLYNLNFFDILELNNANQSTLLDVGDIVILPKDSTIPPSEKIILLPSNSISYTYHTVISGDTLWNIAIQYGIPLQELLDTNNLTQNSALKIGDSLKIPVHNIGIKKTLGDSFGELLDWETEANYVLPVNAVFKVTDFFSGRSFYMKRTTGSSHADCEPLTSDDANIIKNIWGGTFSWDTRPILINYQDRTLAASMSSFSHAGNDNYPGGIIIDTRSGNYGTGYNFDWVKDNSIDGVMDIHFLNSTRHSDGKIDANHQKCIYIAAGIN